MKSKKKKFELICPNCNSHKIIQDRHPLIGKIQYYCKTCSKYFSEDSLKGYPPSNIPFPVIAYLLYFRRKVPEFSDMRKFRKFASHWLKYLKISDCDVSRQIVHHWINNYDRYLDRVISFSEACNFCKSKISDIYKIPVLKPVPYGKALKILENKFGKVFCINLARNDPVFFQELCDSVSQYGVFGWEFLETGFGGGGVGYRSTAVG